jgi:hypothetical protein
LERFERSVANPKDAAGTETLNKNLTVVGTEISVFLTYFSYRKLTA